MIDPKDNQETGFLIGWVIVALVALSGAVGHAFGRFGYGVIYPALRDDLVLPIRLPALLVRQMWRLI